MQVRHTPLKLDFNPFFDHDCFIDRKFQLGMKRLSGKFKNIWKKQNGKCTLCGMPIDIAEERDIINTSISIDKFKWSVNESSYVHHSCFVWFNDCSPKG